MSNKNEIIDGLELELKIKEEELNDRDNTIKHLRSRIKNLRHQMFELETRIEIFQDQITPSVAESIKKYRNTITNFEIVIRNKDKIIRKLSSSNSDLKSKNKKLNTELTQLQSINKQLYEKIQFIPFICEHLINEINERDKRIHSLSEQNVLLKGKLSNEGDNKTINKFLDNLKKFQELIDIIDDKKKKIEFLRRQIEHQKQVIKSLKEENIKS
ncbi:MAG: hypothetical protein GF329_17310 [Candidatus Lokiarchaeota archaeon]|nr:hypothetical protein [Candidatus Lokiarchaeota archaeon]